MYNPKMKRICSSCHIQKDIESFSKVTTPSYSSQRYNAKCKFCTNLYVHDLSYEDYQKLVNVQEHKCSLCERSLDEVKINIDHDHTTGQVRGILCKGCNVSLGTLEKSLESIENKLQELDKQRTRLLKTADYLANPPFKKV